MIDIWSFVQLGKSWQPPPEKNKRSLKTTLGRYWFSYQSFIITVDENIFSKHTKHVKYNKVIISTLNLIMLWLSFKRLLNPTYDVLSFQCKKKTTSFSAELGNSSSFSQNWKEISLHWCLFVRSLFWCSNANPSGFAGISR